MRPADRSGEGFTYGTAGSRQLSAPGDRWMIPDKIQAPNKSWIAQRRHITADSRSLNVSLFVVVVLLTQDVLGGVEGLIDDLTPKINDV